MVSLLRNMQLWNFVNPQLAKNGSNVIDKVQVVFFPCSHLLVFNSCSCMEVKQITSNEKEKCTSHLFLFITYRYILVVFGIHQNIISFLQWLLSKQQFRCTLFPQFGYTSSLYVLAFLFVPKKKIFPQAVGVSHSCIIWAQSCTLTTPLLQTGENL